MELDAKTSVAHVGTEASATVGDAAAVRPGSKLRRHATIHLILAVAFLLGVPLWNHVTPLIFGLPFSVFVTAILLPALFVANMALYVRSHWAEDVLASNKELNRTAEQSAVRKEKRE